MPRSCACCTARARSRSSPAARRHRRAVEPRRQAAAADELQRQVGTAGLFADLVDLDDPWVLQPCDRLGLGAKARAFLRAGVGTGDHDLECDGTLQRRLGGFEHQPHAAPPQQLADLIAVDHRQRRRPGDRLGPRDRGEVQRGLQALAPGQPLAQQRLQPRVVRAKLLRTCRLALPAQLLPLHE
jgi:hypothetical protein